jgi:cell pole-organizing protein PopZ
MGEDCRASHTDYQDF